MTNDWLNHLAARGARAEHGVVRDFGDASAELDATTRGSVLADLSHLAVITFSGPDAREFLNGQLSCDVKALAEGHGAYGSYNTAKGRMLATFLLWQGGDDYHMLLSRSILATTQKRLQMFVLRAKVKLVDRSDDLVLLGANGPQAAAAVAHACGVLPANPLEVVAFAHGAVLGVRGDCFVVAVEDAVAADLWDALARAVKPVGTPCWEWLEIVSGVPCITAATQDQFVPQMANLELIGGVSFNKGCYPGQEIVARTQYLGKLKRRMHLARVAGDATPAPGDALYSEDVGDQANGMIMNAARAPGGGHDVLAVVQSASAAGSVVRLGAPGGPALRFRPLPYLVE